MFAFELNCERSAWKPAIVGGRTPAARVIPPPSQMSLPWSVALIGVCGPKVLLAVSASTSCQVPCSASVVSVWPQTVNRIVPARASSSEPTAFVRVVCCFFRVFTCVFSVATSFSRRFSVALGGAADQAVAVYTATPTSAHRTKAFFMSPPRTPVRPRAYPLARRDEGAGWPAPSWVQIVEPRPELHHVGHAARHAGACAGLLRSLGDD